MKFRSEYQYNHTIRKCDFIITFFLKGEWKCFKAKHFIANNILIGIGISCKDIKRFDVFDICSNFRLTQNLLISMQNVKKIFLKYFLKWKEVQFKRLLSAFFAASMHFHFYFHLLLVYERWILNWEIASKDSHNFALGVMSSNLIELKFICRLILCELMRKVTLEFLSIIVGNKFAGTLLKMIERWFQALKLVIMTFSGIYIVARYAWSSSPYSIFTILRE